MSSSEPLSIEEEETLLEIGINVFSGSSSPIRSNMETQLSSMLNSPSLPDWFDMAAGGISNEMMVESFEVSLC